MYVIHEAEVHLLLPPAAVVGMMHTAQVQKTLVKMPKVLPTYSVDIPMRKTNLLTFYVTHGQHLQQLHLFLVLVLPEMYNVHSMYVNRKIGLWAPHSSHRYIF